MYTYFRFGQTNIQETFPPMNNKVLLHSIVAIMLQSVLFSFNSTEISLK